MRRLTAAILFAIFALLPASPLWSAPADSDCCCGKNGHLCCRMAHKSSGPRFEAGSSCQHGCAGCAGGLSFAAAGILPAVSANPIAPSASGLLLQSAVRPAKNGYFAVLHQRPPPALD